MARSKEKFFKFEKENYNPTTEKFEISNIEDERERLKRYIEDKNIQLANAPTIEAKGCLASSFSGQLKGLEKELNGVKTNLKKEHLGDLIDQLGSFNEYLKAEREEMEEEVGYELAEEGLTNIFYKAPAYEIRTGAIIDEKVVQKIIDKLNELGIDAKVYKEGKKVDWVSDENQAKKEKEDDMYFA